MASPPVSPDGRWWWDGTAWRPMPPARPASSNRVWWFVGAGCLAVFLLALLGFGALSYFTWRSIQSGNLVPSTATRGELPAGFPSDFPAYPGATVQTGSATGTTFRVDYVTSDAVSQVCSFYRTQLSRGDWRLQTTVNVPLIGENCVYGFTNSVQGLYGSVTVVRGGSGRTGVMLTLSRRRQGG